MTNPMVKSALVLAAAMTLLLVAALVPALRHGSSAQPISSALVFDEPARVSASPVIAQFVADHPETHVLRAIATDIDQDGDLDVLVSTTDAPVVVWINDGTNHFTRRRLAPSTTRLNAGPSPRLRTRGRALPSEITRSHWSYALSAAVCVIFGSGAEAVVHSGTAPPATFGRFASGPSRAPPSTHTA